jgi:hypothetical protein
MTTNHLTPKDKARELYGIYYRVFVVDPEHIRVKMAKRAAKITCKQIDNYSEKYFHKNYWSDTDKEIDKI